MRDIAKNIREARVKNKLTQDELAERLFVTRQTVSNYETGKSRPDIDMLLNMADVLGTDVNVLLYGTPRTQKKEVPRSFWIALAITFLLGMFLTFFYTDAVQLMQKHYIVWPALILRLHIVPLFYVLMGWTVMCGIGIISGAKPLDKPWVKYLRWLLYSLFIAYFAVMTPQIIHGIKSDLVQSYVEALRDRPGALVYGYSSSFALRPQCLNVFMGNLWLIISSKEPSVMILGILLWLFGFPEKSDKNYIALLIGLVLTIAMYFGAEQSFVLEVENPEEFQSLAYGIEVREATE